MRNSRFVKEVELILDSLPEVWTSWKSFFWTYPLSLTGVLFLSDVQYETTEEFLIWILIATLSHLAMTPFILYGSRRKGVGEQILLVVLMGFTRGAVISLLAPVLGVTDSLSILDRTLNSTVAIFYWFQVGSILIHFMFNFRKDVRKLIEESIILDSDIDISSQNVTSEILIARIADLQKRIMKTLEGNPSVRGLQSRAEDIDQLVKERLRPLSHSEWREGELNWIRAGVGKMILTTLGRHPLPLWGIVILTLPFSLAGQISHYGILETAAMQSLWIMLAIISRVAAENFIRVRNGDFRTQNLYLILLTLIFIAPITYLAQVVWPGTPFSAGEILVGQILSSLSFAAFCAMASLTLALREDEKSVFRAISEQMKASKPDAFLQLGMKSHAEAEYAQYLHAEVQSQLLACKLLLLKAAENDFTLFPPEITKQILARLEAINQPYTRAPSRLPSERIGELATSWRGLADIDVSLPPEVDESHAPRDVISQLVEEAVVNAIRHGKAKKVSITASAHNKGYTIEIIDDGVFDEIKSGNGLGTILFDTFSSEWAVLRDGDKTVARFTIPRKEQKI